MSETLSASEAPRQKDEIYVNVPVSEAEKQRILREERTWGPLQLMGLLFLTLGVSLVVLYLAAQTTSETTWADWLTPI